MKIDIVLFSAILLAYELVKLRKQREKEQREAIRRKALIETIEQLAFYCASAIARSKKAERLPEGVIDYPPDVSFLITRIRSLK